MQTEDIKEKMLLICAQLKERMLTVSEAWQSFHEIDYMLTPSERREVATFIIEKEEALIRNDYYYPPHAED